MKKSKHQIYTDLEYKYRKERNETWRMVSVEILVEKYPNDMELGKAIREFVNLGKDGNGEL